MKQHRWLRSPLDGTSDNVAFVNITGKVNNNEVDNKNPGVRPASPYCQMPVPGGAGPCDRAKEPCSATGGKAFPAGETHAVGAADANGEAIPDGMLSQSGGPFRHGGRPSPAATWRGSLRKPSPHGRGRWPERPDKVSSCEEENEGDSSRGHQTPDNEPLALPTVRMTARRSLFLVASAANRHSGMWKQVQTREIPRRGGRSACPPARKDRRRLGGKKYPVGCPEGHPSPFTLSPNPCPLIPHP